MLRGTATTRANEGRFKSALAWYSEASHRMTMDSQVRRAVETRDSSLTFIAVIVGLICLFYLICTFQCMKLWLSGRFSGPSPATTEDTVLVHEGRVFNLSGDQRRAVLQAIFSESSKAATDSEVSKKRRKKTNSRDESLPMNIDIEIPGIPTIETEASNDTCESEAAIDDKPHALHHSGKFDDEDHCRVAPWSREEDAEQPPTTPLRVAKNPEAPGLAPNDGNGVLNESFGRTIAPTAPTEAPLRDTGNETPIGDEAMTPKTKTFKSDNPLMPLAEMDDLMLPDLVPSIRLSKNFAIPEDEIAEEGKEGIQASDDNSAGEVSADDSFQDLAALAPIPLVARESFTTVASEYTYADDDSTLTGTLDNVCPICLSGYRRGDLIFSSRHCVHLFHKDCIIQWVEKCTDCPVCRTGLVTDSEMRTAATSLVGKTRMFRAVASMQRVGTSRTTPPNTPDGPPANSQSPFHGTMRRQASSYES